jgi:hypothetical protein
MFQTEIIESIKTHTFQSIKFSENRTLYEIMWGKYDRATQATNDNIMMRKKSEISMPDN